MCVPVAVKNLNIKVFNQMLKTNDTRNVGMVIRLLLVESWVIVQCTDL